MTCLDDKLMEWVGQLPKCKHGGLRNCTTGECMCLKHYSGRTCDTIVCDHKGKADHKNDVCVCPDIHITGNFCEKVNCENNGRPLDDGSACCKCPSAWSGCFCDFYSSPWAVIIGCIAGGLVLIIVFWIMCQLYWNKRSRRWEDAEVDAMPEPLPAIRFRYRDRDRFTADRDRDRDRDRFAADRPLASGLRNRAEIAETNGLMAR